MRRKMKKFFLFVLYFSVCLNTSAQTLNEIMQKMDEIRKNMGNSMARNYLLINHSKFTEKNEELTYLVTWTSLTSNMWHETPTDSLKMEYRKCLERLIDEKYTSKDFVPTIDMLRGLTFLTTDYYEMLYEEGNNELVLTLLRCIHRWYTPYPEARKTTLYARCLFDLCSILKILQINEEFAARIEEYIEVSKNAYGDNSTQYANAIYYSCSIPTMPASKKVERIKKAISIYEVAEEHDPASLDDMRKALNIHMASMTGVTNTDNIKTDENDKYSLNECHHLIIAGRYSEAMESLLYYKDVYSRNQPIDTIEYSKVVSFIISAYFGQSELAAAQKELEEFDSKIGINNLPIQFSENFYTSAGLIAMRLRDYPKALRFLHSSLKLADQIDIDDIEYCKKLGNLGITYAEAGKSIDRQFLLDAKWYIDEAVSVFKEKVGPLTEHGAIGLLLLNNEAYVYDALGETNRVIDIYETIVKGFADKNEVKESWAYAANNLGAVYLNIGKYEKCIDLLQKIKTNNKDLQDGIAQNIVLAYYLSGKSGIRQQLMNYNEVCRNNCLNAFAYFSESELEDYWTYNARTLMTNNIAAGKYPEVADVAYDNALFTKGLTLMSAEIVKDFVIAENKPALTELYNRVKELRQNLKYKNDKDSLPIWQSELHEKERVLIQSIPNFKERFFDSFSTWDVIKQNLSNDELAIEFVYLMKIYNLKPFKGDLLYGALILSNDNDLPRFVTIGERSIIDSICSLKETDALNISDYYNTSRGVYENIWKKMEPYMMGKRTIYFTPTGSLNSINFDAIVTNDGHRLGDNYNLVRLSTTSKIVTIKQNADNKLNTAAIYGGINYDESVDDMKLMAQNYASAKNPANLLALRAEDERGRWNLLRGTKQEIENIEGLFKNHNLSPVVYSWNDANEESFKAMDSHSPTILHLSTHGFFLDTTDKINANPFMSNLNGDSSTKDDMLTRTGLLFSGANNVWTGKETVNGAEDGILTADEISRLDLKNTRLVVLSACETAKGHIDDVEGVLGLQRAFKKAGAGSIVMSLWKVPDMATSILMTSFYEHLLQGKDARTALKEARKHLMNQNEAYKNPYYWAAFVVLD